MKGMNIIQLNTLHLNVVLLNGDEMPGEVVVGGGEVVPVPPTEPETPDVPDVPVEPKKFILSASVTNGMVSATRNGSAVNLPFTANEGDTIVVSVTPNDGYAFEGWADGNTDNPRSITMTADVALSAQCVEVVAPPVGNYIQFEDNAVEAICVANWSSDGIGLTEEDAAAVTSIGTTFTGNTEVTSFNELRFFTGVTSLSFAAFSGCSNLATIDLSNITEIKAEAFRNCTELSIEVIIPNVANILKQTFVNTKITKLVAENIVTIESSAFGSCANLKEVDLGISVQSIGWGAFSGCSALESVVVRATTPPSLAAEAFKFSTCPIYVPDASLEAYKGATNWNQYADRIHPLSEIEGGAYGLVSDGNAYIVTDYYPNTYDNVEVEFESPSSSTLQLLLGSRESLSYKNLFVAAMNPSSGGGGYVDRFYSNTTPPYVVTNGRNNIKLQLSSDNEGRLQKDLFMHNDKLVNTFNRSFEPTEYVMPYPLVVFSANQMNSSAIDTRIFKGKIYFVKITDARSGEVKLYLQPKVVDGVAGMMDTISGTFYTNSNTKGTFIVE